MESFLSLSLSLLFAFGLMAALDIVLSTPPTHQMPAKRGVPVKKI